MAHVVLLPCHTAPQPLYLSLAPHHLFFIRVIPFPGISQALLSHPSDDSGAFQIHLVISEVSLNNVTKAMDLGLLLHAYLINIMY